MRYFFLSLSVMVLLFAACSKNPTITASTQNTLRTGKWKLSSGTVTLRKPNGLDTTLNYLLFIPDCYKDDYLVFDSLNYGRRYTGSNTCSPADPQYFTFSWRLRNNNATLDLYNGFNYIYGIVDTVQPYKFDTLNQSPLQLDTVLGTLDTTVTPKLALELDTIRDLMYFGVPAGFGPTGDSTGGFDIYNADLINLSSSSFVLHFQMISYYTDSTKWHDANDSLYLLLGIGDPTNPGLLGINRPDTFNYSLTFTNF